MDIQEILGAVEMIRANNNMIKQIYNKLQSINAPTILMSLEEVAEYTKYKSETISKKYKHEIGFVGRGRNLLFKRKDVDKWIDRNYTPGIK